MQLFESIPEDELSLEGLHTLATAHSEAVRDIGGAEWAIALTRKAIARIETLFTDPAGSDALNASADGQRRLAGLLEWRWHLSHDDGHLDEAIRAFAEATRRLDEVRRLGWWRQPGIVAQAHLRHLLLLRIRDGTVARPDAERNLDAILATLPKHDDLPEGLSWLRWWQAIALADSASAEAQARAIEAVTKDADLRHEDARIGRWQYRNLRRFIDQHLRAWRNPANVALVARVLEYGEAG